MVKEEIATTGRSIASGLRRMRNQCGFSELEFSRSTGLPIGLVTKLESGVANWGDLAVAMTWLGPLGYRVEDFYK